MHIENLASQSLLNSALNLKSDKIIEFELSENSFEPVLKNPTQSRFLGEVSKTNGSIQHFYIAPMTIFPSKNIIDAFNNHDHTAIREDLTGIEHFRTPAFIIQIIADKNLSNYQYGNFRFYPISKPTQSIWNKYYKSGSLFTERGDILLNNTYGGESANWCFGLLEISKLYMANQIVDNKLTANALESIVATFIRASANDDLGYNKFDLRYKLVNSMGVESGDRWTRFELRTGFWVAQQEYLKYKYPNLSLKQPSEELTKALDLFWEKWLEGKN